MTISGSLRSDSAISVSGRRWWADRAATSTAELLEEVHVGVVGERVHGIEPQPVDVEVPQPHQRVVEDVAAHLRRALAVEVDQVAPGVLALGLQVGPEQRQVVARRAEVVVDDVLDHAEARRRGSVDEALVGRRAAVGLVDGEPEHAVVAPVVGAVERVDRHQLDEVDAEGRRRWSSLVDRRVEGALGGEGADVQLVERPSRPAGDRSSPRRSTRTPWVEGARALVHAVRAGAATAGRAAACSESSSR